MGTITYCTILTIFFYRLFASVAFRSKTKELKIRFCLCINKKYGNLKNSLACNFYSSVIYYSGQNVLHNCLLPICQNLLSLRSPSGAYHLTASHIKALVSLVYNIVYKFEKYSSSIVLHQKIRKNMSKKALLSSGGLHCTVICFAVAKNQFCGNFVFVLKKNLDFLYIFHHHFSLGYSVKCDVK